MAEDSLEHEQFHISLERRRDRIRLPSTTFPRDSLVLPSDKTWIARIYYQYPLKVTMGINIILPSYLLFKYPAEVSPNGILEDPMAITLAGHFSEKRLADWLSFDYVYEKD